MWQAARQGRGNAALEAALIAPALVLLSVGIVDYGLSIQRKMQVQHAAQAGADYAMRSGFNAAAITGAVTGATAAGISALPAPVESCGCAAGTAIVVAACSSLCADGTTAGTYVTVSAQGSYSTLLPYPGIPAGFTFNATAVTRMR
jgi:Flp pilus assembly protein TadG